MFTSVVDSDGLRGGYKTNVCCSVEDTGMNCRAWLILSLAAGLMLHLVSPGRAAGSEDAGAMRYADSRDDAELEDGRRIHLVCMGQGSPTVILTAGMGDWSQVWSKVQPQLGKRTRVCAWDRAGFGFSAASGADQTVLNTTADLEAALARGGIRGPFVMVGHSLGGYESMLFADRHPRSVAGMVLIDPSIPKQWETARLTLPTFHAAIIPLLASQPTYLRGCAADIKSGKVTNGGDDSRGCLRYPSTIPVPITKQLASLDSDPARFDTKASLFENFVADGKLVVNAGRSYHAMPLVVLTAANASQLPTSMPADVHKEAVIFHTVVGDGHAALARLSTRGEHRVVAGAGHYIHVEKPEIVIQAIEGVVAKSRRRTQRR